MLTFLSFLSPFFFGNIFRDILLQPTPYTNEWCELDQVFSSVFKKGCFACYELFLSHGYAFCGSSVLNFASLGGFPGFFYRSSGEVRGYGDANE